MKAYMLKHKFENLYYKRRHGWVRPEQFPSIWTSRVGAQNCKNRGLTNPHENVYEIVEFNLEQT